MAAHISVLLQETIDSLDPHEGDTVLDGTLGSGGHARLLCGRIGPSGMLIGIDADTDAIDRAQKALAGCAARIHLVCENTRHLDRILAELGVSHVNRIVFDLGISTPQLEDSGRGFSFQREEPLVMTFATEGDRITARDIVNEWQEESLADVIYGFGEERFARRIAKAIVGARTSQPIETTTQLVQVIADAVPAWYRRGKTHYATRTFQALRIATNEELTAIKEMVEKGFRALAPGGRMAVISFHSLEDRIIKQFFKATVSSGQGTLVHKKPIAPSTEEVRTNPRARSAKLRTIEKLSAH